MPTPSVFLRRARGKFSIILALLIGFNGLMPVASAHERDTVTRRRRVTEPAPAVKTKLPGSEDTKSRPKEREKPDFRRNEPDSMPKGTSQKNPNRQTEEPEIRIGLVTNADFVSITCDGPIARLDDDTSFEPEFLADKKITVLLNNGESRRNQRGKTYRVQVASFKTPKEADSFARKLGKTFEEPAQTQFDPKTKEYAVSLGEYESSSDAQVLMVRVLNAGYRKPWVERVDTPSSLTKKDRPEWKLRTISGTGDEVVANSTKVTFVALEPETAPLKYLNSTYRGKLEVSLNRRQKMTVVNALPMEEYVRGVVPNELSPNVFPKLEALKAQAVAARTYAVRNKGQFSEEGFDLLPTALSQVYGGRSTEHPLTNRAVEETRGMVAMYQGEPINALYTSTCGGRTEDVEFVFGKPVPYLKSVVTGPQERIHHTNHWLESGRRLENLTDINGRPLTRELALLAVAKFDSFDKVSTSYLTGQVSQRECLDWADHLSTLARRKPVSDVPKVATDLGGFARLLLNALYGSESPARLLTEDDAEYLLGPEHTTIPTGYLLDVAFLVKEGVIRPYSDGTLKGRSTLTRGIALGMLARAAAMKGIPKLESGTARPYEGRHLVIRGGKGKDDVDFDLGSRLFLFRKLGGDWVATSRAELIGGETIGFHLDDRERVDYLEISPAANGAASDRYSQFSWWDVRMTPDELRTQLAKNKIAVGQVIDIQPVKYGRSNRVASLEIVGTERTTVVDGLRIRSVLGVRESLFVIDRTLDEKGRVTQFRLRGRGWGHGVGMCQVGAYGLAVEGYRFDQILKHFYTGIELKRIY
ncbi:MAG: SpoIID/LytB domain-containing protein [Acidobacteria bacterium]|nr:SpoIID/LytB domain-containing protein [Acidobacteriota bacterium]